MTSIELNGPVNILVVEGLTMMDASPFIDDIRAAAPPGSTVEVVSGLRDAFAHAGDVEVMLGILNEDFFAAAPNLRWIHATASGVDMFMFERFVESDVVLTGEKGLVGGHLADTGWGLLLALTRQIHTAVRLGPDAWNHRVEMRRNEIELAGLTMGLVGFGGTGREMARRAVAFGMKTIAVDWFPAAPDHGVVEVWGPDRLDDLLAQADVVSVNLPLTDQTHAMFDSDLFAKMKPGSYLVNVTRGEIVDGDALVAALRSGHLAGAALDVAPGEPLPPEHPLFHLPNVAMTPHTAGASQLRAPRNVARFVRNLVNAQSGLPFEGVVDKRAGF
ncbi:MAG: D-2-hydroxyacid dehydrogenase [Acidimicrobiales bacterium]|nr:D-2-hydroxyacid dehydrogenase [Acidimicrobiales bacterium]